MAKTITHQIAGDETTPALFGEADHLEYAQNHTFTGMIFEALTEQAPTDAEIKLLDLILNLSIDHGPKAPSSSKTIEAAKTGSGMGEAVGAGIEQINEHHGGAGEPLMRAMYEIKDLRLTIEEYVRQATTEGKRIPGLGHRVYKDKDPRAELIMETALREGVGEEYIKIIREIRDEVKKSGKDLPINIDGAIAAVLCGFGLKPEVGIAVFIIARTPGLCAHYIK